MHNIQNYRNWAIPLAKGEQKSYYYLGCFCVSARQDVTIAQLCEVKQNVTGAGKARRLRYVTVDAAPLRALLLSLFLFSGILAGYAFSARFSGGAGSELRRYLESWLTLPPERSVSSETAFRTAVCFFRAPVLAFLLGFASIGVVGLPILFAAQGFLLSFSLCSFAGALGRESFLALPALFAIRLLFVLPCTLLLGAAALDKAGALAALSLGGKRERPPTYGTAYWYRFALCCVCLLIGSALELWLVPLFLARM